DSKVFIGGSKIYSSNLDFDPGPSTTSKTFPAYNSTNGIAVQYSLSVMPAVVTDQPDPAIICEGNNASFNISATGESLSYKWQVDDGTGFTDISDDAMYSGSATATLDLTAVTVNLDGYKYRCAVTPEGGTATYSDPALLTVNPTATVTAIANQTYCNSAAAAATTLSSPVSGTTFSWTNSNTAIGLAASGSGNVPAFTATNNGVAPVSATITVTPSLNGCPGTPLTYTITVNPTATVTANMVIQTICSGTEISEISFSGLPGTSYNWTRDHQADVTGIPASGTGNISGSLSHTSAAAQTVTFTVTPVANGCNGAPVEVKVVVNALSSITTQPSPQVKYVGENAVFAVEATGAAPVSYQWQVNTGSGWSNVSDGSTYSGVASATLSVSNLAYALNGFRYRCVVTGGCSAVNSDEALLTVGKRPTTLTYSGDLSKQYSDLASFKAMLIDQLSGAPLQDKSISYALGSQSITATTNAAGETTANLKILQDPSASYSLITAFAGDDSYLPATNSDPFDIEQENARIDYTGAQFVATSCQTCTTATIQLRATVQDISVPVSPADPLYDGQEGDIRKARVKFVNRDNNADISGWIEVSSLLDPADSRTGMVTFDMPVTLGTNEDARPITVGILVDNGYYVRDNATDNSVVTVYKPLNEFVTGGGHIVPSHASGEYASDAGQKMNFGLNLKFNKRRTSLQGGVNIIFRKTVGGELRTFQIKSNAMTSLGVSGNSTLRRAEFISKANLKDITDPLNVISLGGSLDLTITLSDLGEPGDKDSIGVTLYGNAGSLLYSSSWLVTNTLEKELAGGNIVIKGAPERDPVVDQKSGLKATVYPNPSPSEFTLNVYGIEGPYYVTLYDIKGRELKTLYGNASQPLQFGADLKPGTYIINVQQWNQKFSLKIIKQ
ncbi:MAG TPA: PKD-like domain-containing protein, partial [Chitinophagaceae bacterium]|nr:PKD-like domain-containing protein [Chitinophagaceae bacterium]